MLNLFGNSFSTYKTKNTLKKCGIGISVANDLNLVSPEYIEIGNNFSAESNCKIQAWAKYNNIEINPKPLLKINDNVSIMSNCHISCMNKVIIKNNVLMGDNVFITDNFHGKASKEDMLIPPLKRELYSKGPVIIKKNVWLGRNVCVMPNVTIGEGAIIGANSVVTKDIPAYCVAAGVPAKIIKDCTNEIIKE